MPLNRESRVINIEVISSFVILFPVDHHFFVFNVMDRVADVQEALSVSLIVNCVPPYQR
jgi:hypothetical protein